MFSKFLKKIALIFAIILLVNTSSTALAVEAEQPREKLSHGHSVIFAKWSEPYSWVSTLTDGDKSGNKWSDWKRVNTLTQNWLSVVFGSTTDIREAKVDAVNIYFHTDGGISVPTSYEVQYYTGAEISNLPDKYGYAESSSLNDDANWTNVQYSSKPNPATGGFEVRFNEVTTKAIRIVFNAAYNKSIGLKELEVYGKRINTSPVQSSYSNEQVRNEINSLQNLDQSGKNDFLVRIGSQTNQSLVEDARKADSNLAYYKTMQAPAKPELPPLEGPIYGGWFRTWHDKHMNPLDLRPNSFGEMPAEVNLAFVFNDHSKPYSDFWKVLTEQYVPQMNARGQRVLKTITVRETYQPINGKTFANTPEGIRQRAEYIVKTYVTDHGLDGLDIDIEYHDTVSNWSYSQNPDNERVAIETMKEVARILKSQGKIFMIDTNMNASQPILRGVYDVADYVMIQAYGRNSIESDWNDFKKYIGPEKYILGFSFYEEGDRNLWGDISDKVEGSRAERYALWNPTEGRKAGIVGYAIDRDGVAMRDDEIYHTNYSLSKQLKQLMDLDLIRDNAITDLQNNQEIDVTLKNNLIEELRALRPNSREEINTILSRIPGNEQDLPVEVTKNRLNNYIEIVEKSYPDLEDIFTEASKEKITKALAEAKVVSENPDATQDEVDEAYNALFDAFNNASYIFDEPEEPIDEDPSVPGENDPSTPIDEKPEEPGEGDQEPTQPIEDNPENPEVGEPEDGKPTVPGDDNSENDTPEVGQRTIVIEKVEKTLEEIHEQLIQYKDKEYSVLNITVLDQNNNELKVLDTPVTVEVEASEVNVTEENIKDLLIFNNHDGQLIEIENFELLEGKLVFESDKFSDYVFVKNTTEATTPVVENPGENKPVEETPDTEKVENPSDLKNTEKEQPKEETKTTVTVTKIEKVSNETNKEQKTTQNPKTGDVGVYAALTTLVLAGAAFVATKKK